MRVLHVLHISLPHLVGYSIRSNYILENLHRTGHELAVVTSARHPNEGAPFQVLDGIPYWRTPNARRLPPGLDELRAMWALERRLRRVVSDFRPDVIHAHSPSLVGLPAARAARAAGVPLVYEVRDLWENASVDHGKFAADSLPYRIAQRLEAAVFRRARAVVTICDSLRRELEPRVGAAVHVVPNGVDTDGFAPRPANPELVRRLGLGGRRVIGYVGTFQPYEGLDVLIRALPAVLQQVPEVQLVITGGGGNQPQLEQLKAALGLDARVTFTGRVPHGEVLDMYAQADLLVYPRVSTRTTRLTTPLKPLEAMAMGKPVIVSDVPAMGELVVPGETGLTFRAGDSTDLAAAIVRVLGNPALGERLGRQARQHVVEQRQWATLVAGYPPLYRQVLER